MCLADGGTAAERPTPAASAQQLADVALAVYEAGGPGIHLPLDGAHALVAVLRRALEREGRERPGKEWQVGAGWLPSHACKGCSVCCS